MEAPTSITCPDCRARWQRYHDEKTGRAIIHSPIGYVVIYLELDGLETYLCTVRSYADLRTAITTMEAGTRFTCHLCIFMDEIGGGFYTRIDGGVAVRHESRACEGLHLAMCEAENNYHNPKE